VLKISEIARSDSATTFKLEGKLLGPWLEELRSICMRSIQRSEQISLDLAAVTFVDGPGATLMTELIRQGVTIVECSGFVAELLHVKKK